MRDADAGGTDHLALAVSVQYRMATTGQLHLLPAPDARIEQTRWRLAKLRAEGLMDRITLPRTGKLRVRLPVRGAGHRRVARATRPAALEDGLGPHRGTAADRTRTDRRRGRTRLRPKRPPPWRCVPAAEEAHHAPGSGEAAIPDALLYYRCHRCRDSGGSGGAMLRAFVEVDRTTMGPERLAAKLTAYARLHTHVPAPAPDARRRPVALEPLQEE